MPFTTSSFLESIFDPLVPHGDFTWTLSDSKEAVRHLNLLSDDLANRQLQFFDTLLADVVCQQALPSAFSAFPVPLRFKPTFHADYDCANMFRMTLGIQYAFKDDLQKLEPIFNLKLAPNVPDSQTLTDVTTAVTNTGLLDTTRAHLALHNSLLFNLFGRPKFADDDSTCSISVSLQPPIQPSYTQAHLDLDFEAHLQQTCDTITDVLALLLADSYDLTALQPFLAT